MANERQFKFETLQLHVGQEQADPATGARAVPIYQTTSYVFRDCQHASDLFGLRESGDIYSRLSNPTQEVLERRLAALEGGSAALAVASGAAAVTYTVQALARKGQHVVAANTLYGGTYNLFAHTLPDYGIETTFVDPGNGAKAFETAIRDNTQLIYIESVGNPNANLIDIASVATVAHRHKIPLVVDSTFATPYLLRPFEYGADIVVHSTTKFIGGHGTTLGGVVIESGKFDWGKSGRFPWLVEPNDSYHGVRFYESLGPAAFVTFIRATLLRDTGAAISPFSAFLLLQGVETLSLRVERHVENALAVVDFLEKSPQVAKVNHPSLKDHPNHTLYKKYFPRGGATIFTFELKGGAKAAETFVNHLKVFSLLANVADVKSLVIHPASTTHSQMTEEELLASGITPGTIRLSIGTEHIDDLLWDLKQALAALDEK